MILCRQAWLEYFQRADKPITVAFWSATLETERLKEIESHSNASTSPSSVPEPESDQHSPVQLNSYHQVNTSNSSSEEVDETGTILREATDSIETVDDTTGESGSSSDEDNDVTAGRDIRTETDVKLGTNSDVCESQITKVETAENSSEEDHTRLLTGDGLVELLLAISPVKDGTLTTVGMVKYTLCLIAHSGFIATATLLLSSLYMSCLLIRRKICE